MLMIYWQCMQYLVLWHLLEFNFIFMNFPNWNWVERMNGWYKTFVLSVMGSVWRGKFWEVLETSNQWLYSFFLCYRYQFKVWESGIMIHSGKVKSYSEWHVGERGMRLSECDKNCMLIIAVLYTPPHVPPDSTGLQWTLLDSAGLDRTPTLSHIVTFWVRRSPLE